MGTQTRPVTGRSQRDELEQIQEELRDVRQQREALPRENAELAAQVDRLKEEVRALEQARATAQAEWTKPAPSLPALLVPPFRATPSRRTAYGRMRFAFRQTGRGVMLVQFLLMFTSSIFFGTPPLLGGLFIGATLSWVLLRFVFSQAHEDDDERLAWSFDEEGFGQIAAGPRSGKVLYSEVRKVEVSRGWLQRLSGVGSVRVTWTTSARPSSLGTAVDPETRVVDIDLHDAPERLAEWLLARTQDAREEKPGGPHAG
jgi:hypothetical protein